MSFVNMKIKALFITTIISLFVSTNTFAAWDGSIADSYADGDGSPNNPYQIATASQLALLASNVNNGTTYSNQYFILTEDIDLFGMDEGDTIQWIPIGYTTDLNAGDQKTNHRPFSGYFDGQNHIISNLFIHKASKNFVGLFGYVGHCHISNVTLENVNIYATENVGALCGYAAYDTYIDNCHVMSGAISGYRKMGGLVGRMKTYFRVYYDSYNNSIDPYNSRISHCTNHANLKSYGYVTSSTELNGTGGILGYLNGYDNQSCGHIENCINYGQIEAVTGVGGICGAMYYTNRIAGDSIQIENCHNYGTITPGPLSSKAEAGHIGGIVGSMIWGGTIRYCTNSGDILYAYYKSNASGGAGGIAGNISQNCRITNCVNFGDLQQRAYCGGICGNSDSGTITYCLNAGRTTGTMYNGGITGNVGTLTNCISVNSNSGAQDKGQIAGKNGKNATRCYFDKQNIVSYKWGTYEVSSSDSWGKFTHHMVGDGLKENLSTTEWIFTDGMYPRPRGVENQDITILAATPIFLKYNSTDDYADLNNVQGSFLLGSANNDIEWSIDSLLTIHENTCYVVAKPNNANSKYRLYAHLGNATRLYEFKSDSIVSIESIPTDTTTNPMDTTQVDSIAHPKIAYGFTINADGEQVAFSPGNLQYQASTDVWRFADNEYDIAGFDNAYISPTNSRLIDLFGWGTGNNPILSSFDDYQYPTFVDWGTNHIVNSAPEYEWRTLTYEEWNYILSERANAMSLYGQATVNGVHGLVLLSDNWENTTGLGFTPNPNDWATNNYTPEQWVMMSASGAIFLPCAGWRNAGGIVQVNNMGTYWSSTPSGQTNANYMHFDYCSFYVGAYDGCRYVGQSVRLVRSFSKDEVSEENTSIDAVVTPNAGQKASKAFIDGCLLIHLSDGNIYDIVGRKKRVSNQ